MRGGSQLPDWFMFHYFARNCRARKGPLLKSEYPLDGITTSPLDLPSPLLPDGSERRRLRTRLSRCRYLHRPYEHPRIAKQVLQSRAVREALRIAVFTERCRAQVPWC